MKATAIANSNIALSKYWGKRDDKLVLPYNSSISMTLDNLHTKTTVDFNSEYEYDKVTFWDNWKNKIEREIGTEEIKKIVNLLEIIRKMSGKEMYARVETENNFPTAAGLASSASGFAALALAGSKAIELDLDKKELSILARKSGSGSAARSIEGGFVEFKRGEKDDGSDSYAEQIFPDNHWNELNMVVAIVSKSKKKVSSTEGMGWTVETSPYYGDWLKTVGKDLDNIRKAIKEKDFSLLGKTAESNCMKMHAAMMTTSPPLRYWKAETFKVMDLVTEIRDDGTECYYTIDAGPNVKILCLENDAKYIQSMTDKIEGVEKVIKCKVGKEAQRIDDHLF